MASMLDEYRIAAHQHGHYTREGNAKKTNAAYDRLAAILGEMAATGEDQLLFSLYDDKDPWVQLWAAGHTLELDEARAIKKLKQLQRAAVPHVSFSAELTISEWKSGELLRFREQANPRRSARSSSRSRGKSPRGP